MIRIPLPKFVLVHLYTNSLPVSFQTAAILVLAVILAVYGHIQPYKHRLTNLCEVANLMDFIILLSLRKTPSVIDKYFQFPDNDGSSGCDDHTPKGVATISWVLLPVYYLPVLLFIAVAATHTALYTAPAIW